MSSGVVHSLSASRIDLATDSVLMGGGASPIDVESEDELSFRVQTVKRTSDCDNAQSKKGKRQRAATCDIDSGLQKPEKSDTKARHGSKERLAKQRKKVKKAKKKLKKEAKKKKKKLKAKQRKKKRQERRQRRGHSDSDGHSTSSSSSSSSDSVSASSLSDPDLSLADLAAKLAKVVDIDLVRAQCLTRRHGLHGRDTEGNGLLHLATKSSSLSLVAWLLRQPDIGDVLDLRNFQGETPLLVASRLFRGRVALLLVEALADPAIADATGDNPEGLDVDGLLREAELDEAHARNADNARLLAAVADARQRREEVEWRERLFGEYDVDNADFARFESYRDLEEASAEGGQGDWMEDIARQVGQGQFGPSPAQLATWAARDAAAQANAEARTRARARAEAAHAREPFAGLRGPSKPNGAPPAEPTRTNAPAAAAPAADPEEARQAARALDEAQWREFEAQTGEPQRATMEVPWPSGPKDNPLSVDPKAHPAMLRSQLRAGLLRWHPDKFEQRFGRSLAVVGEDHKSEVLSRVKAIAQQLTRLMAELLPTAKTSSGPR